MTDMPDTTLTGNPSHHGDLDDEYDDAAGYYTPGAPVRDTKAPGGPVGDPNFAKLHADAVRDSP